MLRRAMVTIVTRNYAHYAKVLMRACRRWHPEADLFVCYADHPPQTWSESSGSTRVYADQLGIDEWSQFSFQYTPFELACALKPFAIQHLMDQGYDEIVYLDGDMCLYGQLKEVFSALKNHSIVLTPHLLRPLPLDGQRPDESAFLVSGPYNAGFLAVRRDANSSKYLSWWQSMVRKQCIVDLAASLFVDQKWLSLVPGLFEGVHLLRHAGYNAGHWSLSQFAFGPAPMTNESTSGVTVGDDSLVLFHFSGMTPNKPSEYLSSQTRTSLAAIPSLQRLVSQYHRDLSDAGMATCHAWGCQFDTLNDGTPIHPGWREAIRRAHKGFQDVTDPYDAKSNPDLVARFQSIEPGAYKWRRDWRLKWPQQQGTAGKVRRLNDAFKSFVRGFRNLRKSA